MKTLLKVLAVLVLLVVVAVGALLFLLDPNSFKPQIQALADKQGVHLAIDGDLSWQFWPSLGIAVNDISLASNKAPTQSLATLHRASLLVASAPLLHGELVVEHLIVDGAKVRFRVDKNGKNNWQKFLAGERADSKKTGESQAKTAPPVSSGQPNTRELTLAVNNISFTHAALIYTDKPNNISANVTVPQLALKGFNLDNRPFSLRGQWRAQVQDKPLLGAGRLQLAGKLAAHMQINKALTDFLLTRGSMSLAASGLQAKARVASDFTFKARQLKTDPVFSGSFTLTPVNIKKLLASLGQAVPQTADPKALTHLALRTEFAGSTHSLTLAPVKIVLDDTTLKGELALADFASADINAALTGDKINIDHYLPPPAEAGDTSTTASAKTSAKTPVKNSAPLIPLEPLRALKATFSADLQQVIVSGLRFNHMRLRFNARDGLLQVTDASTDAYSGHVQATGSLNARGKIALINLKAKVKAVQVAPLLKDLHWDKKLQVSGALNVNAQAKTRGVSQQALMQALVADAQFNGAKVKVAPINVEKYFCQMVTLAGHKKPLEVLKKHHTEAADDHKWPAYTTLHKLDGSVKIRHQVVTINTFSAGVSHLNLGVNGDINLAKQDYDLHLPVKLLSKITSKNGCTVNSNYWLNRSLSLLRCRGSLAALAPAKDCGLDAKALKSLAGDYSKYRLKKEMLHKLGGSQSDSSTGKKDKGTTSAKDAVVKGVLNKLFH